MNQVVTYDPPSLPSGEPVKHLCRHLVGWYLFEFGTSILIFNGGIYFSQWLVIDNRIHDKWFNGSLILSSVIVLTLAPILGNYSDKKFGRKIFLIILSAAMFLGVLAISMAGKIISNHRALGIALAIAGFIVAMTAYQLSLLFFNALLARVSSPSDFDRISGHGFAARWLGAIVGIIAILPFVDGRIPGISPGRSQAFLPSAFFFALIIIPSLWLMPDDSPLGEAISGPLQTGKKAWKELFDKSNRLALWFLLAYFLFNDAVLTIEDNAAIYLQRVARFSDDQKASAILVVLMSAFFGSLVCRRLMKKLGMKNTLMFILGAWCIILAITSQVSSPQPIFVCFGIIGILLGMLLSASRVFYLDIVPVSKRGQFFGFYSTFERIASALGPLIWSVTLLVFSRFDPGRYRAAMISMAIIIGIGLALMSRLPHHQNLHFSKDSAGEMTEISKNLFKTTDP